MRTRIKGLVAVVIASAAIGGALAAPASASQPMYSGQATCLVGGNLRFFSIFGGAGTAHQAVARIRKECDRGTLEYTLTRVG
jgi:hypothetical protein